MAETVFHSCPTALAPQTLAGQFGASIGFVFVFSSEDQVQDFMPARQRLCH